MMKAFGRVLAHSDAFKDTLSPTTFKLFVEYYDCHAAQYAYERAPSILRNVHQQ